MKLPINELLRKSFAYERLIANQSFYNHKQYHMIDYTKQHPKLQCSWKKKKPICKNTLLFIKFKISILLSFDWQKKYPLNTSKVSITTWFKTLRVQDKYSSVYY